MSSCFFRYWGKPLLKRNALFKLILEWLFFFLPDITMTPFLFLVKYIIHINHPELSGPPCFFCFMITYNCMTPMCLSPHDIIWSQSSVQPSRSQSFLYLKWCLQSLPLALIRGLPVRTLMWKLLKYSVSLISASVDRTLTTVQNRQGLMKGPKPFIV